MASNPTVVFPSGLGGAAAPQSIGHGPAGPVQTPPGMGSLPSQAAGPMSGRPQLFIPQMPYPSGTRGNGRDSRFRHGSASVGAAGRSGSEGSESRGRDYGQFDA